MRDPQAISMNEDERLFPIWSIVAASLAFLLVEYYFWVVAPGQRHHPPPALGLRLYFNLSWGVVSALYFLMVGYISKDSPRRGMSPRFWMVVCFVMPAGIGAVLYFLLRQPEVSRCPSCQSGLSDLSSLKNCFNSCWLSSSKTPPTTSTRWFKRDSFAKSSTDPQAPAFGSLAPKTTRGIRARIIAPRHMAQGSSVTKRVVSVRSL